MFIITCRLNLPETIGRVLLDAHIKNQKAVFFVANEECRTPGDAWLPNRMTKFKFRFIRKAVGLVGGYRP